MINGKTNINNSPKTDIGIYLFGKSRDFVKKIVY